MPKRTDSPIPTMRWHNGAWQILWRWNKKQYSVSTGLTGGKADKVFADILLRQFAVALSSESPDFPDKYAQSPGVTRFLNDRFEESKGHIKGDWLTAYNETLQSECSKVWATRSMMYLRELADLTGSIQTVTPAQAQAFLNGIIASGNSPATRNRAFAACNRFFKWAIRMRVLRRSPFEGIKLLPEERHGDIVYCTKEDREEIIAMAKASKWPEWLAVPIAFYTGMRREEITRLVWPDIRFKEGIISVGKTKTGTSRLVPLSSYLEKMLIEVPKGERTGHVVKALDEFDRPSRLTNLVLHMRTVKERQLAAEWGIVRPILYDGKPRTKTGEEWKKAKEQYRKDKREYERLKKKYAGELSARIERIGWNPFRHTFGSLLAQSGVSLDKISAWMGNTPEVCRRHYAQFIPRDKRDDEIDKL